MQPSGSPESGVSAHFAGGGKTYRNDPPNDLISYEEKRHVFWLTVCDALLANQWKVQSLKGGGNLFPRCALIGAMHEISNADWWEK